MNNYVALGDLIKSISKTHKFDKDELVFLNTSDVLEGYILIDYYTPVFKLKGQAKKTIQNGDILYSEIRPKNKRYAYVRDIDNTEDYVVSTKLMVLRNASNQLNTDYLYHFLTFQGTIDYLQKRAENRIGSFPQITFDIVKTIKIWLPELQVQKQIAKVLSDLDTKIEVNNKLNQELEAMAKTLYDYWFVQFDFPMSKEYANSIGKPELAGKPYKAYGGKMLYNAELKREIPEGWEVKELNALTTIVNRGIGPKYIEKGGIPVINQRCIRGKEIDFELTRRHDLENKNTSKLIEQYDILVNSTGVGTLGRSAVVKYLVDQKVTVDSHVTIVRADQEKVNTKYLAFSITELQPYIEQLGVGSTGQTELSRTELGKLNIILPVANLQSKFSKIIKNIWQKQSNNQKENQKLAELRDWLLPMLMNGQLRVGYTGSENEYSYKYIKPSPELLNVAEAQVDYSLFDEQNNTIKARKQAQILTLAIESHSKLNRNLYRTKGEKLIEVVEKHLLMDFGRKAIKMAAGPADFEYLVTTVEPLAKRNDWFVREKKKLTSGGQSNKYIKGSSFNEFFKVAQLENQENIYELERVIDLFTELKTTREAEVVATTYTAWNNLIIRQEKITDNAIVKEAREDWHKKKLEIAQAEFKEAIKWLRKNDLVPKGSGKEVL